MSVPAVLSYWSELARPVAVPLADTPTTLVRANEVSPPYVTDELIAELTAGLASNLLVQQWDCDHMVPLAKPAETATLIRDRLG